MFNEMKRILFLATLLSVFISTVRAQEYIDREFTLVKNISFVILNGKPYPVDATTNKATLTNWNFGAEGNTAVLTLDLPEIRKQMGTDNNMEYAWSGKNLHIIKKKENGGEVYAITRVRNSPIACAYLMQVPKDGKLLWVAMISPQDDNTRCISDVHAGMTRMAVESKCKELGFSRFEFKGNDNNMKVYNLLWLDMKKKQHWFGREDYHYEVTNDKTYGYFWFDANDKLVKWLMP